MVKVIQVDFHLIWPNYIIIIGFRVCLLGKQFFLFPVFYAGRSCDAGAKLKDATVVALQLVGIARHIGAWPNEAHLSNEDIDQLGEAVHLAVAQPVAHACNAWVVGRGDRVAFGLVVHGTELTNPERLAAFSDAFLEKENRTFRVDLDKNGNGQQWQKEHNKAYKCHNTVEAPLEEESYFVFIFRHAA